MARIDQILVVDTLSKGVHCGDEIKGRTFEKSAGTAVKKRIADENCRGTGSRWDYVTTVS